jgi:hypothetical protein
MGAAVVGMGARIIAGAAAPTPILVGGALPPGTGAGRGRGAPQTVVQGAHLLTRPGRQTVAKTRIAGLGFPRVGGVVSSVTAGFLGRSLTDVVRVSPGSTVEAATAVNVTNALAASRAKPPGARPRPQNPKSNRPQPGLIERPPGWVPPAPGTAMPPEIGNPPAGVRPAAGLVGTDDVIH